MSSAKWRPFCLGLNVLTGVADAKELGGPYWNYVRIGTVSFSHVHASSFEFQFRGI